MARVSGVVAAMVFVLFSTVPSHALSLEVETISFADRLYRFTFSGTDPISIPELLVGTPVDIAGVGATYEGLYYVDEVTHVFSSEGGYSQSFVLERDGTGLVDEDGNTDLLVVFPSVSLSGFHLVEGGQDILAL